MPRNFISPTGQAATEDEACVNGVVRDGYRLGFDLMHMDSNGPGRMYLLDAASKASALDAPMHDAEVQTVVARERMIHDTRFAFLGDKAPPFDAERALVLANARVADKANRASRDAALAGRYNPVPVLDRSEVDQARAQMIADMHAPSDNSAVRDLARLSRYQ